MTDSEFLKEIADKIERLPTMFAEDEVKRLRAISEVTMLRWQPPLTEAEKRRRGL